MQDERIGLIAHNYGLSSQLKKLAEECCELGQAALKCEREGNNGRTITNLTDEIADVKILIEQIEVLIPAVALLELSRIEYKLNRQMKRMKEEKASQNV